MKLFIYRISWIYDYYIVYFLYNPQKINTYYKYMFDKWNINLDQFGDREVKKSNQKEGFISENRYIKIVSPKKNSKISL